MGEIVGAGLVAHVPTIMLPEHVRLEINDGKEISLVPGLRRLRSEVLDRLKPDTVIVLDTHWESTFEHIVTAQDRRAGKFTSLYKINIRQKPSDILRYPNIVSIKSISKEYLRVKRNSTTPKRSQNRPNNNPKNGSHKYPKK